MSDYIFEWDEEKNKDNIEKHGISFELARNATKAEEDLYNDENGNS